MTVAEWRFPLSYHGDIGSFQTLQDMRSSVASAIRDKQVVQLAHWIIRNTRARDYAAQAFAIRDWMKDAFRFVSDPVQVELVRSPIFMVRQFLKQHYITGDCDEAATLGAALGKSVGIPASFVVIGFRKGGNFAHVYTVLKPQTGTMKQRVSLDITKPFQVVAPVRRMSEVAV